MGNAPSGITPSRRRVAQGLERFDALLVERKKRCVELCTAMMHPRAYLLQERTMARRRDELREYRITMEAIVSAPMQAARGCRDGAPHPAHAARATAAQSCAFYRGEWSDPCRGHRCEYARQSGIAELSRRYRIDDLP